MKMNADILASAEKLIALALKEDLGRAGDVTSKSLVSSSEKGRAVIMAKSPCVVSGGLVAAAVFKKVDPSLKVQTILPDGARAGTGATVLEIRGSIRSILTAERTALNFMQRLSGTATLANQFVRKARGVMILDTRKTAPGFRLLEKYAVQCGGGHNHRMGLYDRILIKDNHRRLWRKAGGKNLADAVQTARKKYPGLDVEIEVESEADLRQVLSAKPEWVLLDNMPPVEMKRCVKICSGQCKLEASGGISMENISAVAASGVDAVSLGCLTHSAPAADLSLELEWDHE
ncbi:MAG: carboxylating nicotinate-nucleotide diphosphorylase [Kiritimatiellia bacterium]